MNVLMEYHSSVGSLSEYRVAYMIRRSGWRINADRYHRYVLGSVPVSVRLVPVLSELTGISQDKLLSMALSHPMSVHQRALKSSGV